MECGYPAEDLGSAPGMTDPRTDAALERLDRAECELLLASKVFGRLAVLVDGRPNLVPVSYASPGGGLIVFRAALGTVLMEASLRDVAFEIDDIDPATCTGWSVEVKGRGRDITDALDDASVRLRQLRITAWAPGARPEWFKIDPDEVTGRRLS